MNRTQQRIEEINKIGYQLDFSNVFNHAFENYKKIALYAGSIILIFYFILGLFGSSVIISLFGIESFTKESLENLQQAKFTGTSLAIYMASMILLAVFTAPFTAGFLKMADCADKDKEFNVATIFYYYKLPYLTNIIIATFIISVISIIISTTTETISLPLIGGLISLLISLFTYLTVPLIVFGNLNAIDAIKTSVMLVSKQPLIIAILLIVAVIAAMVGFIGCCIGVVFTLPFIYSMNYAIYCAIIGADTLDEVEASNLGPKTFL
ncbi:DUF2189 domain-containing protein [Flavobacterium hydatis]|uniref:Beta-carotene 15,15'-monooxygenase n=1 Tax=Flavobacterium hydatis TaxID=991 RepID=A0A086A2F2_FLAHY|nr:hypothetical protein [Flavobacterium hydatis]KFF10866.1 hypothetical protein IW20_20475 [Flavobacterium hydatis]OXA94496.1 hypothetical protein B0A62_09855 [Flavobacterium hydatis]